MNRLQAAIAAATLLFAGSAFTEVQASQVLTVPYSSALATVDGEDSCVNNYFYNWAAGTNTCSLVFPLTIPVGHVIHQISVFRTNQGAPAPAPYIHAALEAIDQQANNSQERFLWESLDYVPVGTIENHRLMSQTKFGYPDEFSVAPNTSYEVFVIITGGELVDGIQITYD